MTLTTNQLVALRTLSGIEPAEWHEFATVKSLTGKNVNCFQALMDRGMIVDDGSYRPYKKNEAFTGPRLPKYKLTPAGKDAISELPQLPKKD